jgi:hypothetical protein
MIIAAEITSILQILFVLSLIRKKYKNKKNVSVDFLFLNNYVNDRTIKAVQDLLVDYEYPVRYFDYRNQKRKIISDNKTSYDTLILRSRIPTSSSNRFIFYRGYFVSTGNCDNSKLAQISLTFKKMYTVDDGLSNWEGGDGDPGYLRSVLSNRKASLPIIFSKVIPLSSFVEHFSIFSIAKRYSIMHEFSATTERLSLSYDKDYEVEDLFIGIWPAFKEDRLSTKNADCQMKVFCDFIKNNNIDYKERKYFIKYHPKYNLDNSLCSEVNFVKLKEVYANAPLEVIVNRFPNLKNIYGFPSTCFYLMSNISDKEVNINIFVRKGDDRYFPERAQTIKHFNRNVNLIYI